MQISLIIKNFYDTIKILATFFVFPKGSQMTFSIKHIALAMATVLTLTACGGDKAPASTTEAPAQATDSVKVRQDLMQDWRGANDIMKGMLENPANFDAATFKEQAEFIQSNSAKMWEQFADANAKGKSQDAVWSDAQGFQAQKDAFDVAVAELVTVAGTAKTADDVAGAFGKVAESCGSCHKVYKQ